MPNVGERGRKSSGAVLLENQRQAAAQLRAFHMQMRRMGPTGPVLPAQKEEANILFRRLQSFFSGIMREKARGAYKDPMNPEIDGDLKRVAVALYLNDYLKEAHRHALKANVSGDFALFISTFHAVLNFLENKYFIKPVEQNFLDFMLLKGSLDACADACRIASLDFDAVTAKYADSMVAFIRKVESEDRKTA